MVEHQQQEEGQEQRAPIPPDVDEILDATNQGLDILAAIIPDFKDGKRGPYFNPCYDDGKPGLSIYQNKQGLWCWRDFGEQTGGDAIALYRRLKCAGIEDFTEVRRALSAQFMGGAETSRQQQQPAQKRPTRPQFVQTDFHSLNAFLERPAECLLHDFIVDRYGTAGQMACSKYGLRRGNSYDEALFPIVDQQGRLRTWKHTRFRVHGNTITKKDISGKPLGIYYDSSIRHDRVLFGSHLVKAGRHHIGIVEAEDTAIIAEASGLFSGVVWLSSGGPMSRKWLDGMTRHWVTVFPDLDATEDMIANVREWSSEISMTIDVRQPIDELNPGEFRQLFGVDRGAESKQDLKDFLLSLPI